VPKRQRKREHLKDAQEETLPLTALRVGASGYVRELHLQDQMLAQKLIALGVVPGARLKILQRFPAYVIQIDFTQIAIDHHLAKAVRVQPDAD
jgi:Fe2+ transport system protein FeoA